MNTSSVNIEKVSKEQLEALAEQVPGAWIGMKIAVLLLVKAGRRPAWIAENLGINRMNINRWIRAVNKDGVEALLPKKQPGRPARITPKIVAQVRRHMEDSPRKFGFNRLHWDGPVLVKHLERQFGIKLNVRQAQNWMHQLGYRLSRANDEALQADGADAKKRQGPGKMKTSSGPLEVPGAARRRPGKSPVTEQDGPATNVI